MLFKELTKFVIINFLTQIMSYKVDYFISIYNFPIKIILYMSVFIFFIVRIRWRRS